MLAGDFERVLEMRDAQDPRRLAGRPSKPRNGLAVQLTLLLRLIPSQRGLQLDSRLNDVRIRLVPRLHLVEKSIQFFWASTGGQLHQCLDQDQRDAGLPLLRLDRRLGVLDHQLRDLGCPLGVTEGTRELERSYERVGSHHWLVGRPHRKVRVDRAARALVRPISELSLPEKIV